MRRIRDAGGRNSDETEEKEHYETDRESSKNTLKARVSVVEAQKERVDESEGRRQSVQWKKNVDLVFAIYNCDKYVCFAERI